LLVDLGFPPSGVPTSGTTALVVLFASLAGFLGHAAVGRIDMTLLLFASAASVAGAILGGNLMSSRLKGSQVKSVVGGVLYLVASKLSGV